MSLCETGKCRFCRDADKTPIIRLRKKVVVHDEVGLPQVFMVEFIRHNSDKITMDIYHNSKMIISLPNQDEWYKLMDFFENLNSVTDTVPSI
jgi:hypothetical protein